MCLLNTDTYVYLIPIHLFVWYRYICLFDADTYIYLVQIRTVSIYRYKCYMIQEHLLFDTDTYIIWYRHICLFVTDTHDNTCPHGTDSSQSEKMTCICNTHNLNMSVVGSGILHIEQFQALTLSKWQDTKTICLSVCLSGGTYRVKESILDKITRFIPFTLTSP